MTNNKNLKVYKSFNVFRKIWEFVSMNVQNTERNQVGDGGREVGKFVRMNRELSEVHQFESKSIRQPL